VLCHAGGWTDMTKLILTFRSPVIMTKKAVLLIGTTQEGQKCNIWCEYYNIVILFYA